MSIRAKNSLLQPFAHKMRIAGVPEPAVRTFLFHLERVRAGVATTLGRGEISPVHDLPDAATAQQHRALGVEALARTVVIKLNGGLGTSMGLDRAKSLLEVRDGLSFLDLIARQVLAMRANSGVAIPLLVMNSFRTEEDSLKALRAHPALAAQALASGFRQHRVPKVLKGTLQPATYPRAPQLEWCPPGHGDLFAALFTSGVLDELEHAGIEYAFVSNADNLGAVLDPALLGLMVHDRLGCMMEVADRTAADRKGGHLCRLSDGRLALRESAQCPPDEVEELQDIRRYRFFNTNNVWIRLPDLRRLFAAHDGVLPLPTIVNTKTLDPRDPSSPEVLQLETAMGAAISLFERAAAVRVPRTRFSPVKTTDDLLAVRSDAYELTEDGRIVLHPGRAAPPSVTLDRVHYRLIDDFDARFPAGPPSLIGCDALEVTGDVRFAAGVVLLGSVRITAPAGPAEVPAGTRVAGDLIL